MLSGIIPSGMPAVLGHEGAGQVTEVGGHVTSVAPGQHVVVSWTPACGSCAECVRGQPFLCLTYVIEGFRATPRFTLGDGTRRSASPAAAPGRRKWWCPGRR